MIPFSQQSGIAEWCVNTMSLGDYLIGKNSNPGAHKKYRPDDMQPSEARHVIRVSLVLKLYLLLSICDPNIFKIL